MFQTLSAARSRLYQRRFLRPRAHFSAFFELYIFSFVPFQISLIFPDLCTDFAKFNVFFAEFEGRKREEGRKNCAKDWKNSKISSGVGINI